MENVTVDEMIILASLLKVETTDVLDAINLIIRLEQQYKEDKALESE